MKPYQRKKPGGASDSPEFELVLACLYWPPQACDGDRIRSLAQKPLRWNYLLEIIHHHKVVPLFARNLNTFAAGYIPEETAATLRAETIANAHSCLQRTADLFALNRLFREQQIDLRIFKGIPLAMTAFQDPTLRDAGDIDLLIAEKDIVPAGEILRAQGYLRFEPQARLTPRRLCSYLAHQKDFSYEHPAAGVVIDLHWRLFRNRWLPANATLAQAGEDWINLGTERVATLPAPQLLLYLCVHGALDGWLRLKWLADIAALLRSMAPEQIHATAAAAAERQALPQWSAAVFLCQDLLGFDPAAIESRCLDRADRRVAHILQFGKRLMRSNQERPVREAIPSTQWFLNELRQHSSFRYRVDLVERSLFRPRVWQRFDLPDAIFPLYAVLSPFDWFTFHFGHRILALRQRAQRKAGASPRSGRTPKRITLQRLLQLSAADLALAMEAGCMLTFFRIALNFLPVQRLVAWMGSDQAVTVSAATRRETIRRVEWSIDAIVRHAPLMFVCFPQCLAAYFMLRRRHIASTLFYGVNREGDQLKAHTWVKVEQRTVVGGDVEAQFTVLNSFP